MTYETEVEARKAAAKEARVLVLGNLRTISKNDVEAAVRDGLQGL